MLRDYIKRMLATAGVFVCVALSVSAVGKWDFKFEGINYKIVSMTDKTVAVANSSANPDPSKFATESYSGDVVIPSTVTDSYGEIYSVVKINKYAFHTCSSLTSVTIPASVTEIEDEVFVENSSLTSLDFPSTVTSIGSGNFVGCSLEKVEIWNKDIDMSFLATMPAATEIFVHDCRLDALKESFGGVGCHTFEEAYVDIEPSVSHTFKLELSATISDEAVETVGNIYLQNADGSRQTGVKPGDAWCFSGLTFGSEYDFVAECNLSCGRTEELYYTFICPPGWQESEVRKLSDTEAEIWLYTNATAKVYGNGIEYREAGTDDVKTLEAPINASGYMGLILSNLASDKEYVYRAYYIASDGKCYYSNNFTYKHTGDNEPSWRIVSDVVDVEVEGTTAEIVGYQLVGTYDYDQIGFVLNYEKADEAFVEAESFCDGWSRATVTGLKPNTEYCVQIKVALSTGYDDISLAERYFTTGGSSAIEDVAVDELNTEAECVVRSVAGVVVASGCTWGDIKSHLAPGIYLLTIGDHTTKVLVK